MNDILKKALNRGAPIETPILIGLLDLLSLLNKETLYDDYRKCITKISCKLSNIMEMYGAQIICPIYATPTIDENNSRVLTFSGENYYSSILVLFNYDNDVIRMLENADKSEFEKIKKRILSLSLNEIKIKFPSLYDLYLEDLEANENFLRLEEICQDKNIDLQEKINQKATLVSRMCEFYPDFNLEKETKFAKEFNLNNYLTRIFNAVEKLMDNAEEVIATYMQYQLNLNDLTSEDEDKLNLYIAYEFMRKIEDEDTLDKQRYLFYLTNYFRENVETKVTRVKLKLNGKKVNPITLYERYKKLLVANPELLTVNFSFNDFKSMNKDEVEEFIVAYLSELSANWELIPHDDTSVDKMVRKTVSRKFRNISEEERKIKQEKLLNLYVKKKNFYDSTDPYFRVKGKQTFDGYVGYIYSNSIVILDKFYEDVDNTKLAENEAIYIMTMKDFYDLSQHSKTYLMANHLCIRVYHRGEWQKRVLNYIKGKSNVTPVIDTNKLIEENKIKIKEKKNG